MVTEPDADILRALRVVIDPELGVDIVSLGLVYEATREGDTAHVVMTMTAPACPLGESIVADARSALEMLGGVRHADVQLVFDPPWTRERMSPEARQQLGIAE
jgi:metal-sulfur cluster biosynthetic enzyme